MNFEVIMFEEWFVLLSFSDRVTTFLLMPVSCLMTFLLGDMDKDEAKTTFKTELLRIVPDFQQLLDQKTEEERLRLEEEAKKVWDIFVRFLHLKKKCYLSYYTV